MLKAAFLLALSSLASASPFLPPSDAQSTFNAAPRFDAEGSGSKVNVTLYVMSRCPDARLCESVFDDVFKTKGITDKVNLEMGYIAQTNESAPLGLECKHGELECAGNAHQLCLHRHLSLTDFYAVLSCMNYQTPFPSDIGKADFAKRCAKTVGVDWEGSGVGKCVEGTEGEKLFKHNAKETQATNITTSCTIRIDSSVSKDGKRSCVVDGGVWTGCDDGHAATDFVRVIEEEWKNLQ